MKALASIQSSGPRLAQDRGLLVKPIRPEDVALEADVPRSALGVKAVKSLGAAQRVRAARKRGTVNPVRPEGE